MSEARVTREQVEAVDRAARRMGEVAQRMAERMAPALQRFYRGMWAAYEREGKPYGDTDEGLMRWVREKGEENRRYWAAHDAYAQTLPPRPPRAGP